MKKQPSNINYKAIAVQAGVTAVVFALVNRFFDRTKKHGLGHAERLLLAMPLERMSQFADGVTIINVNNEKFLNEQLAPINMQDPEVFKNGNKTTIGNCAFIALHSKIDWARDKCRSMLAEYKNHLK